MLLKNTTIKVIGFSITEKQFIMEFEKCVILLIKDELSHDQLVESGLTINKETDFFLHHLNKNGLLNKQTDLFHSSHIQNGAHEKNATDVYYPLFTEIIFNDCIENKVEVIIERFFKAKMNDAKDKIKTDFLMYIFNGNKPEKFQIPDSVRGAEGVDDFIKYFKTNPYKRNETGSDLCDEQNRKYVQLRKLLGFK